ncbi:hypothetical protein [Marinicella litoralis]|uniref:Uncharacterized protein n=1 Tax=Marinicella litoralis TaxID=644220 RepID=A0A4R6X6E2_9GAMM|nr:hypothetical protein [Marinicella litoralis]TDR14625.1 hypothetical protein C8D91_2952 [Marinicella litoralis]
MKPVLLIMICLISADGFSQQSNFPNHPSNNKLHSTNDEIQSMMVSCEQKATTPQYSIDCNFHQTSISYKQDRDEIENDLNEIFSQLNNPFTNYAEQLCNEVNAADLELIVTETKKEIHEKTKAMCNVSSNDEAEKKIKELFRIIKSADSETCVVNTGYKWTETFVYKNNSDIEGYWVSNPTPSTECGIMNISTLKPDKKFPMLWNYESQRIVTNKDGELSTGVSCSLFEDRKIILSWKSNTFESNCKRIEFSP